MSSKVVVICDDDEVFTGVRHPHHRRRPLGGNSSTDSVSNQTPNVWRPVMPASRRSTLLSHSETEDDGESRTSDMRMKRSISDTPSSNRRHDDNSTFTLHDVDAFSVQRAKVIRRVSKERYVHFRNFFIHCDPELAMEIQARGLFSREHLDAWVNYIVSPKVLHCIVGSRDTQQELLDLLIVSAAISKYGERELMAKDRRGDLSILQQVELRLYDEYSRSRQQRRCEQTNDGDLTMEFVIRINNRLSEERRVGGVVLREILAHASTIQVAIKDNSSSEADFGLTYEETQLKLIVLRVQSHWFQNAILKVDGQHLYDAIRQAVKDVNSLFWDASKDKSELKRVRARSNDQLGPDFVQIAVSDHQIRPRMAPTSKIAPATNDIKWVQSSLNVSSKMGFRVYHRSSSPLVEEIYERKSSTIAGTDKSYRRLRSTLVPRPRGLPPKSPHRTNFDAIAHTPRVIEAQKQE